MCCIYLWGILNKELQMDMNENDLILDGSSEEMKYLRLLSGNFPTIASASTEIINLEAILNLPKGTEHFLADLHGEYEAFQHVLRNASGAVKRKVNEIFGETLEKKEQKELCTLIYYPELKLELVKRKYEGDDLENWYFVNLNRLVMVCRNVSSKYTRSKVRKALPKDFSYIIQELLHESALAPNKQAYVDGIVHHSYVQSHPAAHDRFASHSRRYIRQRSGTASHYGHALQLS